MKAILKTPLLTVELDGATQTELFQNIATVQEVFAEPCCGKCKDEKIQFRVRNVRGDDYYEMVCLNCGATLSFGQSKQKKGFLFPIRKLTAEGKPSRKEGVYDNVGRGWTKYHGDKALNPIDETHDDDRPAPRKDVRR